MGLCDGNDVIDLTKIDPSSCGSFLEMVSSARRNNLALKDFVSNLIQNHDGEFPRFSYGDLEKKDVFDKRLVLPFEPPEVWGCGVTYVRSKKAREYETEVKGIYDMVYDAERPEIFFKATASRCVGPDEVVYIRGDSSWSVPEPELAFVMGQENSILGFTGGNDMSARDIEGQNPLYLPQAKIFKGCCALGPSVVTVDEIDLQPKLQINCKIVRSGRIVFEQATNTSKMKRSIDELRSYLCKFNPIPLGTVCLTGTGIVPPDDFSLREKDVIEIRIEKIGILRNYVKEIKNSLIQK